MSPPPCGTGGEGGRQGRQTREASAAAAAGEKMAMNHLMTPTRQQAAQLHCQPARHATLLVHYLHQPTIEGRTKVERMSGIRSQASGKPGPVRSAVQIRRSRRSRLFGELSMRSNVAAPSLLSLSASRAQVSRLMTSRDAKATLLCLPLKEGATLTPVCSCCELPLSPFCHLIGAE